MNGKQIINLENTANEFLTINKIKTENKKETR